MLKWGQRNIDSNQQLANFVLKSKGEAGAASSEWIALA